MTTHQARLNQLVAMHEVEGNLLPQAAMSIVLWIDEEGQEQVTIYIAQSASGTTISGMLSQALHIMNGESLGQ